MSVLYLVTTPPPVFEGTDAVLQEVAALRHAFEGQILNLCPLKTSTRRFPKQLFGLHKIRDIREQEGRCKIDHLYFPAPYSFPVLRLLRNPVFYTVTASLNMKKRPSALSQLAKLARIIVSSERDADALKSWGLTNYAIVQPGIDSSGITPGTLPLGRELTLLMASAPWNSRQFELKGIDLLLAAAAGLPFLRLILLWRGILADDLARRVERLKIEGRVEIVNRRVELHDYLARAHATVLLARDGGIVRSFPHSLMESLAAGKPVLLSHAIAMSDYVSRHRCGVVVHDMTVPALSAAIELLRHNYVEMAGSATQIGPDAFPIESMVESYRGLYRL
jgi:glycosyltransferase involved in cell wall biosynthesis